MKKAFAIILLFLIIQAAEAREWRNIGPDAAVCKVLIPDRNNPGLWFLVTQSGTLYRSIDLGNRWKPVLAHITNAMIHPITSEVFAWDYRRLWKSTDSGKTFDVWSSDFQPGRIIPHPTSPNTFLGLAYDYFYGTHNSGKTWVSIEPFRLPEDEYGDYYYSIEDALFSPFNPNTIYATLYYEYSRYEYGNLLLVTYNNGHTWRVLKRKANFKFHSDPAFPNRAFATDGKSFYQLTKNESWDLVSEIDTYFATIISVPRHPEELLSASCERLLQSLDTGKTWHKIPNPLGPALLLIAAADDSVHTLLAGTAAGVFSQSKGGPWKILSSGLKEPSVSSVDRSGSKLFVGISGSAIFKYDIPSLSWDDPLDFSYSRYFFHPTNPLHFFRSVYAGSRFGYLVQGTQDGGKTWYNVGPYASAIYDGNNPNHVYFEGEDAIYQSPDEGRTVTPLPLVLPFSKVFSEGEKGKVLYFFQPRYAIWKSTDGGRTIRRADANLDSNRLVDIVSLGPPGQFVVINRDKEIFQTLDGAQHWEKVSQIERPQHVERTGQRNIALISGPSAGHLFALAYQKLYESVDRGKTWNDITAELGSNLRIIDMPDADQLPLAVATDQGVFLGR